MNTAMKVYPNPASTGDEDWEAMEKATNLTIDDALTLWSYIPAGKNFAEDVHRFGLACMMIAKSEAAK